MSGDRPAAADAGIALRALTRSPRRSRVILAAVTGAVAFGVCWVVGMDPAHAAGVAVLLFAAGVAWIAVPEHADTRLPAEPYALREGVRREVIDLSWALRRQRGGIRENAYRRVRALAAARLDAYGLDLEDAGQADRIRALIGAAAYSRLARRPGRFANLRDVTICLEAIERLDPDGQTALAPRSPRTPQTRRTPHETPQESRQEPTL